MAVSATVDSELHLVGAKLRPARPHRPLVPRPRLIESTRGKPVVVVVAEAGYGKSSFLLEWSRTADRNVWYTLDERDNDPTTFGQHLLAALAPNEALHWRACNERAAGDLARLALSEISRAVGEVALVLDDLHTVAEAPTSKPRCA